MLTTPAADHWTLSSRTITRCRPYLIRLEVLKGSVIFLGHISGIYTLAWRCWVVVIEVARVRSVFHLRNNGAFHLAVVECLPIDAVEKRMGLYSASAARDVAKSAGGIDGTEAADKILSVCGHPIRIADVSLHNPDARQRSSRMRQRTISHLIDLHRILIPKWRLANKKFVDQNSKSPPIHSSTVP